MLAAEWGSFEVCDLLLKYAAEQQEILDQLAAAGKMSKKEIEDRRVLLRKPIDMLSEKDEKGRTAKDLAAQNSHSTVAHFLAVAEMSC